MTQRPSSYSGAVQQPVPRMPPRMPTIGARPPRAQNFQSTTGYEQFTGKQQAPMSTQSNYPSLPTSDNARLYISGFNPEYGPREVAFMLALQKQYTARKITITRPQLSQTTGYYFCHMTAPTRIASDTLNYNGAITDGFKIVVQRARETDRTNQSQPDHPVSRPATTEHTLISPPVIEELDKHRAQTVRIALPAGTRWIDVTQGLLDAGLEPTTLCIQREGKFDVAYASMTPKIFEAASVVGMIKVNGLTALVEPMMDSYIHVQVYNIPDPAEVADGVWDAALKVYFSQFGIITNNKRNTREFVHGAKKYIINTGILNISIKLNDPERVPGTTANIDGFNYRIAFRNPITGRPNTEATPAPVPTDPQPLQNHNTPSDVTPSEDTTTDSPSEGIQLEVQVEVLPDPPADLLSEEQPDNVAQYVSVEAVEVEGPTIEVAVPTQPEDDDTVMDSPTSSNASSRSSTPTNQNQGDGMFAMMSPFTKVNHSDATSPPATTKDTWGDISERDAPMAEYDTPHSKRDRSISSEHVRDRSRSRSPRSKSQSPTPKHRRSDSVSLQVGEATLQLTYTEILAVSYHLRRIENETKMLNESPEDAGCTAKAHAYLLWAMEKLAPQLLHLLPSLPLSSAHVEYLNREGKVPQDFLSEEEFEFINQLVLICVQNAGDNEEALQSDHLQ